MGDGLVSRGNGDSSVEKQMYIGWIICCIARRGDLPEYVWDLFAPKSISFGHENLIHGVPQLSEAA